MSVYIWLKHECMEYELMCSNKLLSYATAAKLRPMKWTLGAHTRNPAQ